MSTYDPTDLSAQDSARADAQLRRRLSRDNERDDMKWLMGSKRGRRIIWRQLERAGVFKPTFNTNAMTMAFNEGNRKEGLKVLTLIHEACPEHYQTMVREANEHRKHDDGNDRNDH